MTVLTRPRYDKFGAGENNTGSSTRCRGFAGEKRKKTRPSSYDSRIR